MKQSGTAGDPIVLAHQQTGRNGRRHDCKREKAEREEFTCSVHGRNSTHDTANCRTLSKRKTPKSPTSRSPVAALVTPHYGHESGEEEADEENYIVLTVDEDGHQAALPPLECALFVIPQSTDRGTPAMKGSSRTYPVIADTGASCHLWKEAAGTLTGYTRVHDRYVMTGDGQRHRIEGRGTLNGSTPCNGTRVRLGLHDVCHVPTLAFNLISLGRLDDEGYKSMQSNGTSTTVDRQGRPVFVARKAGKGHVYRTSVTIRNAPAFETALTVDDSATPPLPEMTMWHYRLSHMSPAAILPLFRKGLVTGVDCEAIARQIGSGSTPHPVECHRLARSASPSASPSLGHGNGQSAACNAYTLMCAAPCVSRGERARCTSSPSPTTTAVTSMQHPCCKKTVRQSGITSVIGSTGRRLSTATRATVSKSSAATTAASS